jgi:hypothetical protein
VRDLGWLLLAPRLLSAQAFGSLLVPPPDDVTELVRALHALDEDPLPLHASLAPLTTRRVGHYAERLVHYAISSLSSYTLVAANLPLRLQKQTVGECDFLLEDPAGMRLHWELAVKCYLRVDAHAVDDPLAAFVGPALGDRLDIKLARLLDHQLPLSGRPDYVDLLPRGPWQAQMWVSGWLFDRFDHWLAGRAINVDPRLAADLSTGFWAPVGRWPELASTIGAQGWTRLPRLRWIAPLAEPDASYCDDATMTARIADAFAQLQPVGSVEEMAPADTTNTTNTTNATHVLDRAETAGLRFDAQVPGVLPAVAEGCVPRARVRDDPFAIAAWKRGADGRWFECARGFIVADDWEARALSFAAS